MLTIIQKHHPLTGALYLQDGSFVRVEHEGRQGKFTMRGEWIEGDLRFADPLMCLWMGSGKAEVGAMRTLFSNDGED